MTHNISFKQYMLLAILLLLLISIFIVIPLNIYPAEDAAILFQFSENLAQTGAITYNLNGVHAEGATDFLWMVILGLMHFIGFDTYLASTILSMLALLGTSYFLYRITNKKRINYFLLFTGLLIIMPMIPASIQGFSPLFFGFFIILSVYFFLNNATKKLFISLLLLCLVRPDGVVFAIPLIISFLIFHQNTLKENIKKLLLYFILPGLIYFIWRWNYFGEFLPLPFYVKSNFDRFIFLFNLKSLMLNIKIFGLFFLPSVLFIIASFIYSKEDKKIMALFISIIVIPFIFYSSMMLSQNISFRYQYSIALGLLIIIAYILRNNTNKKILLLFFISQIIFIMPLTLKNYVSLLTIPNEQITYVSKGLNKITTNASMAITEAGRLPYYSKWRATDTWGLNTPKYAKVLIQPNDIKFAKYDLIVVHVSGDGYNSLLHLEDIPIFTKRTWSNMATNIFKGIDMNNYMLYMVPFNYQNDNFLSKLYFKFQSIKREFTGRVNSKDIRYDAYFIRKSFRYSHDVQNLLKKHHAITFKEFIKLNIHK